MTNATPFLMATKTVSILSILMFFSTGACSNSTDNVDDASDRGESSDSDDSSDTDASSDSGDSSDTGESSGTDTGESSDSDASSDPGESIAMELGLTQYTGQITPQVSTENGKVTTYRFDPAEGPVCMRGGEFLTTVRDVGSKDLVVFFQDGGVCWSGFCLAVNKARAGIPDIDILDPNLNVNPVAKWNHVFVPYCDGSFFAGDTEYSDNLNNRGTRYHHGLANMTGALEVAKMRFPNPERILLAGSSGGGYGLLFSGILARHYFPDAELILMADSGIGIAKEDEPEYLQGVLDEFNLNRFIPEACANCKGSDHLTAMLGYLLDRDPEVRVGTYSSWNDTILAKLYLQVPGAQYASSFKQQTDLLHEAYPTRFRRFVTAGIQHTILLGKSSVITGTDWNALEMPPGMLQTLMSSSVKIGKMKTTTINGLSAADWLGALINNDTEVWVDLLE